MNNNVFLAAAHNKLSRVVWASSETTLGLPFDVPPRYAPVDEDHYPFPTTTYALSKVAARPPPSRSPTGRAFPSWRCACPTSLVEEDYRLVPGYWSDPHPRKWNLWGYIDARDVTGACRAALAAPVTGAPSFVIAAADTIMNRPSAELLDEVFPGVRLTREIGTYETLLSIERARDVLGFEPQHSWRDIVAH